MTRKSYKGWFPLAAISRRGGWVMGTLVFHALLFVFSARWVVQTIQSKRQVKFLPGPAARTEGAQRPAEYPVATSQRAMSPPPPLTKITSTSAHAAISLPSSPVSGPSFPSPMSRMAQPLAAESVPGASFSTGIAGGGIKNLPPAGITAFGFRGSGMKGLRGTFYDLSRNASGEQRSIDALGYLRAIEDLFGPEGRMNPAEAVRYFRSSNALAGCVFCFPPMDANSAPSAFGEKNTGRAAWIVRYTGRIASARKTRIRFVGGFDEVLLVLVNGTLVLDGTWKHIPWRNGECPTAFKAVGTIPPAWTDIRRIGNWVDIGPGGVDIEIVIGEGWGGKFAGALCVEEWGVQYEGTLRPVFKMEGFELMRKDQREGIERLKEHLTFSGPIFRAL
jgi:hypothetical protein